MSLSKTNQTKIQQYLQYHISNLKQELEIPDNPAWAMHDRDLSIYECIDYMLKKQAQSVEDLATSARIENLARYCVQQHPYFSSMSDFFQAVNSFYARILAAFQEGSFDESHLSRKF